MMLFKTYFKIYSVDYFSNNSKSFRTIRKDFEHISDMAVRRRAGVERRLASRPAASGGWRRWRARVTNIQWFVTTI